MPGVFVFLVVYSSMIPQGCLVVLAIYLARLKIKGPIVKLKTRLECCINGGIGVVELVVLLCMQIMYF